MDPLCQGDTHVVTDVVADTTPGQPASYEPLRILGFNGKIKKGLIVHPDDKHIVYAMGRFVIIEEMSFKSLRKQRILSSHKGDVVALALSKDGIYVASSQESEIRQKALVLLWDFATGKLLMEKHMHKVSVYALTFTFSSKFLLSLGCQEDGSVVVWSSRYREPICGHTAQIISAGTTLCVAASKIDDSTFATAGEYFGRIWKIDAEAKRLNFIDIKFAYTRRIVISMEISDREDKDLPLVLCGTKSSEVLGVDLRSGILVLVVKCNPPAHEITTLRYLRMDDANTLNLLLGTGCGELRHNNLKIVCDKDGKRRGKLVPAGCQKAPWTHGKNCSAITAIAMVGHGENVYVATHDGHMYCFNLMKWHEQLVQTTSSHPIEALTFARDTDDLLVVGEFEKVRIINTAIFLEVRRYVRANHTCKAVAVNHDGTQVFSGWDCGTVIVLGFGSKCLEMKELYRIRDVQTQPVTCLALTATSDYMVSGGLDGQCRVWRLADDLDTSGKRLRQGLLVHLLSGQTGPITSLAMAKSQQAFTASSVDGSVVIYDMATGSRLLMLKLDFSLNSVCFLNNDLHLVAAGHDGNLHFWEILTTHLLRELKACDLGPVNQVHASRCTKFCTTVGQDELVKFWNLDTGEITHVGQGHGAVTTQVRYGPCGTIVVTGAKNGSLCIWRNPARS